MSKSVEIETFIDGNIGILDENHGILLMIENPKRCSRLWMTTLSMLIADGSNDFCEQIAMEHGKN